MELFFDMLRSIVYGVIEGITEWLPISSTGHMILVDEIIHLDVSEAYREVFMVVIQLGAILAVVVLYFKKLWPFCGDNGRDSGLAKHIRWPVMRLWGKIIVGAWQVLALIPGTSRSGATIIGGLLCGMSRACASQFTFFLAIPVMAGASGLKLVKFLAKGGVFTLGEVGTLLVGCIVAFVVSILAIRFLMDYVKKHTFTVFGWYRIALGILVLGIWALQSFVLA